MTRPRLGRLISLGLPVAVGVAALALARSTMLPGLFFWDTAEFQTIPPILGTAHPTGYPAYVVIGFVADRVLAPFGETAFRMNLLSGLLVAAAAVLAVQLTRRLTGSLAIGCAVGVGLAATPITWSIASRADAHALHLALVALVVWLLAEWAHRRRTLWPGPDRPADRWLLAAAVAFGIAASNHSLTILLVPAIGLYVLAVEPTIVDRPRFAIACAALIVATMTLLYLELPLRAGPFRAPLVYGHPETWQGFWGIVLGEQFRGSLINPLADPVGGLRGIVDFTVGQLGPLTGLLPLGFVVTAFRLPRYALLSGVAFGTTVLFAVSYDNAEIDRYYLGPALFAWTWLGVLLATAGDGIAGWLGRHAPPRAGPTPAGRSLAFALAALVLIAPTVIDLPARATRVDRSSDRLARTWTEAALAALEPGAVVISWWSYSTPLWYAQHVEGRRPDIWVVDDRTRVDEALGDVTDVIDAHLGRRPVYVIRDTVEDYIALQRRYRLLSVTAGAPNLLRVDATGASR